MKQWRLVVDCKMIFVGPIIFFLQTASMKSALESYRVALDLIPISRRHSGPSRYLSGSGRVENDESTILKQCDAISSAYFTPPVIYISSWKALQIPLTLCVVLSTLGLFNSTILLPDESSKS
jgi:hypothetical protein